MERQIDIIPFTFLVNTACHSLHESWVQTKAFHVFEVAAPFGSSEPYNTCVGTAYEESKDVSQSIIAEWASECGVYGR